MYNKVLIAVDGSEPSYRALAAAQKMAESIGEITLIYVIHIPLPVVSADGQSMTFAPPEYYDEMSQVAHETLNNGEKILGSGGNIKKIVESGHPAETILNFIEKEQYDLAIVGSRGLNQVQRLFLGSVSNKIVSLSPCPVMLVK